MLELPARESLVELLAPARLIEFTPPPAPIEPSHWLVVVAQSSKEYDAWRRIEDLKLEINPYCPIVQKKRRAGRNRLVDVVEALLRNYLFVPASINSEQYHAVRHTRGVLDFLKMVSPDPAIMANVEPRHWDHCREFAIKHARSNPVIMRNAELDRVRHHERTIRQAQLMREREGSSSRFMIGEEVKITVGFARLDATVHSIDARGRIEVRLVEGKLFGRDVIPASLGHIERAG